MKAQFGGPSKHVRTVSVKAAYSRAARKKFIDSRAKLDGIKAAIKHAIDSGSLKPSERLNCEWRAMEVRLTTAESRLEKLRKSGEEGWEDLRYELDDAWEDLSHSIIKLVARIRDESP